MMAAASETKTCNKCGEDKPRTEFWKHKGAKDGLRYACKDCTYAQNDEWRRNNLEKVAALNRKDSYKPAKQRYRNSTKGRATAARAQKAGRARHPERYAARTAVKDAIRRGDLERPEHCSECGTFTFVEAHHHNGYLNDVLDVEWLCLECHRAADAALKEEME